MNLVPFLVLFGAGVSSVLAPCVLPLLPAYVTVIVDSAAHRGLAGVTRSALCFVAGFTVVFAVLGIAAGSVNLVLGDSARRLGSLAGVALVVMGALLLLATWGRAGQEYRLVRRLPDSGSIWRPLVLGVAMGAAWTPCVGPLLGTALVVAAGSSPALGAGLLTAYSLGLAVPFLILCLLVSAGGHQISGLAARLGSRALLSQRVAATLIIATGIAAVTGYPTALIAVRATSG